MADNFLISLLSGLLVAIVQLIVAYLYIDKRLKNLDELKRKKDWAASQREFYAHCLSISWSVTRIIYYYIPKRDGLAHIRQNFEKALDDIVEKNAMFDVAARFSLIGLPDDMKSKASLVSVKLSQASSAAQNIRGKLKRLSNNLPYVGEISANGLDAYTIKELERPGVFSRKYHSDLYIISTAICESIEHVYEGADGLRILVENRSINEHLKESRFYSNLRNSNVTPDSDRLNIEEFLKYLRELVRLLRNQGLCFALVGEFDETPNSAGIN